MMLYIIFRGIYGGGFEMSWSIFKNQVVDLNFYYNIVLIIYLTIVNMYILFILLIVT